MGLEAAPSTEDEGEEGKKDNTGSRGDDDDDEDGEGNTGSSSDDDDGEDDECDPSKRLLARATEG